MGPNDNNFKYILSNPVTINGVCHVQYSTQSTFQHKMVQRATLELAQDVSVMYGSLIDNLFVSALFGHITCPCDIKCGPIYKSNTVTIDPLTFQPMINICVEYDIKVDDDQGWKPGL